MKGCWAKSGLSADYADFVFFLLRLSTLSLMAWVLQSPLEMPLYFRPMSRARFSVSSMGRHM